MKMENTTANTKIIGALLIGTAIGGLLGVLFAPNKGSKTRKKILTKSGKISGVVKDKLHDFVGQVKKETEMAKDKANDYLKDGAVKA